MVGTSPKGITDPGLTIKVEVPEFATVKRSWCLLAGGKDQPGVVVCDLIVVIDTKTAGKRTGNLNVSLGDQSVSVPIVASMQRRDPQRPRCLPRLQRFRQLLPTRRRLSALVTIWCGGCNLGRQLHGKFQPSSAYPTLWARLAPMASGTIAG